MLGATASRGIAFAVVCLVLLGTMPVISNSRPGGVDALTFAVALSIWQVIFAGPVFALELRGTERGIFAVDFPPREKRRMLTIALLTGVMFGLSTYLYVLGVKRAGAANAAIAIQAYPLFAILWESLFLGRRKTKVELGLTVVLVLALIFLGTGGTMSMSGLSIWFIAALGVPFLWSIAHVIIKEELGRTPVTPAQVTFFRVAISTVFLLAVLAASGQQDTLSDVAEVILQPTSIVMGLVYFLELIIWFYAVRHIDVSLASSITTPWPALTMMLAAVFLGDTIEVYQIGALIVVILCIYGLTWTGLRNEARA